MDELIALLDFISPRRGHFLVAPAQARHYEPKGMKASACQLLKRLEVRIGRRRFCKLDSLESPIRLSPKRHNLAIQPIRVSFVTPVQSSREMPGAMPER